MSELVCVAPDGSLEMWTLIQEIHVGLLRGELGDQLKNHVAFIEKPIWNVECSFGNSSTFYQIRIDLLKDKNSDQLLVPKPTFWGRECLGEL